MCDRMLTRWISAITTALLLAHPSAYAVPASDSGAPVVVSGAVSDEATKNAILTQLRSIYGAQRVVDQIGVGGVVAPPNWSRYVQKLLDPSLLAIKRGTLAIDGTNVAVKGEVPNEATRQQVLSKMATSLDTNYVVKSTLRASPNEQNVVDNALANRIVEFESGSASLTDNGKAILDEIAMALTKIKGHRVEIVGHTDDRGNRLHNVALAQARAEAVKAYLQTKGIDAAMLSTSGQGPDQPVASNTTEEGRKRNRRIQFRVI